MRTPQVFGFGIFTLHAFDFKPVLAVVGVDFYSFNGSARGDNFIGVMRARNRGKYI
jgi:hypothetical protein